MFKLCVDADSALRERLERTRREAEYTRKKLQRQHEEAIEEHEAAKKVVDRKVSETALLLCDSDVMMLENHYNQVTLTANYFSAV